jgi:hypothetical protein
VAVASKSERGRVAKWNQSTKHNTDLRTPRRRHPEHSADHRAGFQLADHTTDSYILSKI